MGTMPKEIVLIDDAKTSHQVISQLARELDISYLGLKFKMDTNDLPEVDKTTFKAALQKYDGFASLILKDRST